MIWDVMGGVARRSWARNPNAMCTSATFNENRGEQIILPSRISRRGRLFMKSYKHH